MSTGSRKPSLARVCSSLVRQAALALALSLGLVAPGLAQPEGEPRWFTVQMEEVLAPAGSAASILRCTALFRAFRLYAGEGGEIGATAAQHETDLAVVAVVVWQEEMGEPETSAAFEVVVPVVTQATELYLARMIENQEEREIIFDPALESELTYCDTLHAELTAAR